MTDTDPFAEMLRSLADSVSGLKGNDKAAYDSLAFYSRYVMAYNNPTIAENSAFLNSIYDRLQHEPHEDALILGPRGSAKSTAVSVTYTTWMVGRDPLIRILLAFASQEAQGLAFMRQIDTILTKNDRYLKIFGERKPAKPERWTDQEIIVSRPEPPSGLKDATVAVVGLNTAVPSKRADIIICDDLVTRDNAYSDIQRQKVIQFVYQTLFPILVPGGRKIIVGSRWDPRDLYAHTAQMWGHEFPLNEGIDTTALRKVWLERRAAGLERDPGALN